jgi:hypothetical protein
VKVAAMEHKMQNNERFDFRELDTDSRASVLLSNLSNGMQLSISVEKNGDIDLVLSAEEFRKLVGWLQLKMPS